MSRLKEIREPQRCPRPNGISKVSYRSHAKAALAIRLIGSKGRPAVLRLRMPALRRTGISQGKSGRRRNGAA